MGINTIQMDCQSTIQAAIDSIADASSSNRYLIIIPPGLYTEQITMKSWVDLRGASKHTTRLQFTGNNNGTIIMNDYTQIEDLLIEMTAVESEIGIVSVNKSHIHIRNVDILKPFGSSMVSQGIKITGDTWGTCFVEHCVINYGGTTGYGIYIAGSSSSPQNIDTHLNDVFIDSFNATTGGCLYIKDCFAGRMRVGLMRTSGAGFGLSLNRTSTGTVDFLCDASTFEFGAQSLEIGTNTTLIAKNSCADSHSGSGTITNLSSSIG